MKLLAGMLIGAVLLVVCLFIITGGLFNRPAMKEVMNKKHYKPGSIVCNPESKMVVLKNYPVEVIITSIGLTDETMKLLRDKLKVKSFAHDTSLNHVDEFMQVTLTALNTRDFEIEPDKPVKIALINNLGRCEFKVKPLKKGDGKKLILKVEMEIKDRNGNPITEPQLITSLEKNINVDIVNWREYILYRAQVFAKEYQILLTLLFGSGIVVSVGKYIYHKVMNRTEDFLGRF